MTFYIQNVTVHMLIVVVKLFPTLSNSVYFSLRHVNSIWRDNTTKILFLKIDRGTSTTTYLTKRENLPVSCRKSNIYNMPFWNFIIIMTSLITCLWLLSRHLQSLWALKGSTTVTLLKPAMTNFGDWSFTKARHLEAIITGLSNMTLITEVPYHGRRLHVKELLLQKPQVLSISLNLQLCHLYWVTAAE
jgi:hypothetical protein